MVLIERGECSFVSKAIRAQEAGAIAAIITDQVTCHQISNNYDLFLDKKYFPPSILYLCYVANMSSFQDRENDELYISMVDDDTKRKVEIPTGFLLGKNGYVH